MRTLPAALAASLAEASSRLAICWRVTRRDGVVIRGTEHDDDIEIAAGSPDNPRAGTYWAQANITGSEIRNTLDLAPDNLEVRGALSQSVAFTDLSAADIEAGLLDDAAVELFLVDWSQPDAGQVVLRVGHLGNITRTAEGEYTAELRGLAQRLAQNIVRTYSAQCDADLGDSRCGVNLSAYTVACTVESVTSRRRFVVSIGSGSPGIGSPTPTAGFFSGGLVTFTSGANAGYSMELKQDAAGGTFGDFELFMPMAADVQVGDLLEVRPGCDKRLATCRDRFGNLANFRGYGVFTPTQNDALQVGGQ